MAKGKIPKIELGSKFFYKVAPKIRDAYRKHIFKDAKDVYDNSFGGYKSPYKERKESGKIPRQATEYAGSKAPVLTSDFLRDFSVLGTTAGSFRIGWSSQGEKVEHLARMGRVVTAPNQPLPDKVANLLGREIDKDVRRTLCVRKTTKIKV